MQGGGGPGVGREPSAHSLDGLGCRGSSGPRMATVMSSLLVCVSRWATSWLSGSHRLAVI